MLSFLKDHPFSVEAFFDRSLIVTFALERQHLQPLIPPCLELDTFEDRWAFLTVAMVQTRSLRPKGFPAWIGNDFFLIGYRIFTTYTTSKGKRLRGLYIIKSETDNPKMEFFGNLFTHYDYSTTDINLREANGITTICSMRSDFFLSIDESPIKTSLPSDSPFTDWKQARRFAGPLPFTFTFDKRTKKVLIIEGVRKEWEPKPVTVLDHHFSFIDSLPTPAPILANAFSISSIPYYWKKGVGDLWKG